MSETVDLKQVTSFNYVILAMFSLYGIYGMIDGGYVSYQKSAFPDPNEVVKMLVDSARKIEAKESPDCFGGLRA